jgi:hypothetical protein
MGAAGSPLWNDPVAARACLQPLMPAVRAAVQKVYEMFGMKAPNLVQVRLVWLVTAKVRPHTGMVAGCKWHLWQAVQLRACSTSPVCMFQISGLVQ